MAGTAELIVAGGMQNMSRIPISSAMLVAEQFGFTSPTNESQNWQRRYGDQEISQFRGAEMIAEKWEISRRDMEEVRARQPRKAFAAIRGGHFDNEIVAVGDFRIDEGPRESSLEKLAALAPREGRPPDRRDGEPDLGRRQCGAAASEQAVKDLASDAPRPIHHISARGADPCSC